MTGQDTGADEVRRLGRLRLLVAGSGALPDLIRSRVNGAAGKRGEDPELTIHVGGPFDHERALGTKIRAWTVSDTHLEGAGMSIKADACVPSLARYLPTPAFRLAHPGHQSQDEYLATLFNSEILIGLTQLLGLGVGQTYVPAVTLGRAERTFCVVAGGAMGKTGTALRLCSRGDWKYISDDLALVSEDGTVSSTWQQVEIAPRNLLGDHCVAHNLLDSRSWDDRFAWRVRSRYRPRGLRRYASSSQALGGNALSAPSRLTDIIVVMRADVDEAMTSPVSPAEMASMVGELLMRDIATSVRGIRKAIPSISETAKAGPRPILESAFGGLRNHVLRVPYRADEPTVENAIIAALEAPLSSAHALPERS